MPLKVYYLDDEPDLAENFQDTFASPSVQITVFSDVKEAREAIAANPPDLLFLDYRLPNTTGDQLAREFPASIPKALVTGDINVKTAYPFQAIFEKPCSPDLIQNLIDTYATKRGKSK